MRNTIGNQVSLTLFGESHGAKLQPLLRQSETMMKVPEFR